MRILLLSIAVALGCSTHAAAQLDEILKKAGGHACAQQHRRLEQRQDHRGPQAGSAGEHRESSGATGRPDGFLKNQAIRILLPPKLATLGRGMRMLGMGARVDELEVGMNRAAEQATPQAKQIFLSALRKMTFDDARQVLTGGDTAATDYFKRTSSADLTTAFSPIVHRSMERVGVVQQYNQVLASAPGGNALAGQFDIDKYVVGKTLDGLFLMLGEEEKKIRKDPAAQTTALLKEVFGKR